MVIDFEKIAEAHLEGFKGGKGKLDTRNFVDDKVKIMFGRLEPGCSIGLHRHDQNSEIMYILSGVATYVFEGEEETVLPGQVHYNPMGKEHTLMNKGTEDLTFFAVVPEHH